MGECISESRTCENRVCLQNQYWLSLEQNQKEKDGDRYSRFETPGGDGKLILVVIGLCSNVSWNGTIRTSASTVL